MHMHALSPEEEGRCDDLIISPEIAHSPLMQRGGYAVFPDLLAPHEIAHLQADARTQKPTATRTAMPISMRCETRGGAPARVYKVANGSGTQFAIVGSVALRDRLSALAGFPIEATGGGTFSYYEDPGDHLALHRDIVSCEVVLITCLENGPRTEGGRLIVYPDLIGQRLTARAALRRTNGVVLDLAPGDSLVMFGGIIPHELTPVGADQRRVVSVTCYQPRTPEPSAGDAGHAGDAGAVMRPSVTRPDAPGA